MNRFGEKFGELSSDEKYNLKYIGKLIREEIKKARGAGLFDKGFRTSVKVSTRSIMIFINGFPEGVELFTEAYKRGEFKYKRSTDEEVYSAEYLKVREVLGEILNLWNYDNSDSMSDYFDRNYYGDVKIKWELLSEFERESIKYYNEWVKKNS